MSLNDDLMEIQPMTPDYFEDSDDDKTTAPPTPILPPPEQARLPSSASIGDVKVLAASQQTRAFFEQQQMQQQQQQRRSQQQQQAVALDGDAHGIRELEAQVRDAVQQSYPPAELKVLYASLLAKQRGGNICTCRQPRCPTCLNCSLSHCQCASQPSNPAATELAPMGPNSAAPLGAKQMAPHTPPPSSPVAQTPQSLQQQGQQQQQQRRRADISEVAHYYVSLSTGKTGLACDPCSNASTPTGLTCDACSRCAHFECVTREPDMLPRGPWYCKQCFAEASHIYYPERFPPLSVVELGRLVQIVSGNANRLPSPAQIEYVEAFIQRIPTSGNSRLFIHNKARITRTH